MTNDERSLDNLVFIYQRDGRISRVGTNTDVEETSWKPHSSDHEPVRYPESEAGKPLLQVSDRSIPITIAICFLVALISLGGFVCKLWSFL